MPVSDFTREVWCVLGVPIDNITMTKLIARLRDALKGEEQLFLSTPNLNYIATACRDSEFRESLIDSDLSIADGMPILWAARLLKIPLGGRVAGSDLTQRIHREKGSDPMSVFFFGGESKTAERACEVINASASGFRAVGSLNPGFGTVDQMISEQVVDTINARHPDLLSVSIGAFKGQIWLYRHRHRLNARIVSHLGAVVNFFAGSVRRAPLWMQHAGLEWAWRILQEPALWRRYARDGALYLRLVLTRVLPYAVRMRLQFLRNANSEVIPQCELVDRGTTLLMQLTGPCVAEHMSRFEAPFVKAASQGKRCIVDMAGVTDVDARFIGLLFLLRKNLGRQGIEFQRVNSRIKRLFYWNCADYLFDVRNT